MDYTLLYDIIYALAATGGREKVLFGNDAPAAHTAFAHSLVGDTFPELWFELPLLGDPWFDLHVLTSRTAVRPFMKFVDEQTGGNSQAFRWFASREEGVRQLALSWDSHVGNAKGPAVQLLVSGRNLSLMGEFLEAAGRPDAIPALHAFIKRLPERWFACYVGVFPQRAGHNLRVECIPYSELQRAYASDPALLETHLRQAGLTDVGTTLLERCQLLAKTPFTLEFQFDVENSGCAGTIFSASVRFTPPSGVGSYASFDVEGAAGTLMRQIEDWGLCDDRWHLLQDVIYAKSITRGNNRHTLYCYPAFLKLRWRAGEPFDAKTYLIAGVEE